MDVASLYTNIPQEQGMQIVCAAYDKFYKSNPPIPTGCLRGMLRLILEDNTFKFTNKLYLQRHGTPMGTKDLHGGNRNSNLATKQTQTARMDNAILTI